MRKLICRWVICMSLLAGLTACKVELYTDLPEGQANEMASILIANGIPAKKGAAEKGLVPLTVDSADLSAAIKILRENGYPKDQFRDLGDVFEQKGLVASPLEERVRFIYGLSQGVSETLTQIDGVITARVHVVVPEQHPLEDTPGKSTASVFLKTRPGVELENKIPDIKMLVQASVEGLAYDDVIVAIFPSDPEVEMRFDGPALSEFGGIRFAADSMGNVLIVTIGFGLILLGALAGNAYFLLRDRKGPLKDTRISFLRGRKKATTVEASVNG